MENIQIFLEEEFEVKEEVKEMQIAGRDEREMIIMDSWERKEKIMRRKKKFGGKEIYIDNDLSQEESEVQRKLREIAMRERMQGRI